MIHSTQLTANKAKMVQQIKHLKNMELEVKTISERSHEDSLSMSMVSSKVNTPGGHHKNYLSGGGIQRRMQNELAEINESFIKDTDQ